jgi:colicin import membrane protein
MTFTGCAGTRPCFVFRYVFRSVTSDNIIEVDERTCRFPGCQRPVMASAAGTGRPPEYCDDPTHTRASAWRARQRPSEDAARGAEARPVDSARQRASEITGQVSGMIEHLGQQLAVLVEELRTVGDPEAAEAQLESVASEAAEQVAGANARATRAEQAQRRAEAEKAEADAAAEEAMRTSEELARELSGTQEELDAARATGEQLSVELAQAHASAATDRELAQAESAGLRADLEAVRAQLTLVEHERDAAAERAGAEERARVVAERRTGAAESRVEAETARADREESAAEEARAQLAGVRADLEAAREAVADIRSTVATLTAERVAAGADVERERIHGEQRVKDLHDTYSRQIDQLRAELTQAREAKTKERRPRAGGEQ